MTLDGVDRVAVDHDRVLRLEVVEHRGQIGHGRLEELLAELSATIAHLAALGHPPLPRTSSRGAMHGPAPVATATREPTPATTRRRQRITLVDT